MSSLKNKVIAITGGASGIALATAQLLAGRGAQVCIADIQQEALDKAAETIESAHQTTVHRYVVDVRNAQQVNAWIDDIITKFGRLDGAANVAGVIGKSIGVGGIINTSEDEWDFIIGVNLTGVMHCLRAQMKVISDGGSIVNAASIAGLIGRRNNAAYAASKHGVIGLTKSAAKEIGHRAVRVNSVAPGYIDTPMSQAASKAAANAGATTVRDNEAMRLALERGGKADEVANLIAFLLSDDSTFITGQTYSIDGGWNC